MIQFGQYCEKSCETTFWESLDKSLKSRQDLFSCDHPVENSGFLKNWKNYDFWWLFLKNIKMSKSWVTSSWKYDQSCFNFENFAYSKSPLLKLRAVKPAVSFRWFTRNRPLKTLIFLDFPVFKFETTFLKKLMKTASFFMT